MAYSIPKRVKRMISLLVAFTMVAIFPATPSLASEASELWVKRYNGPGNGSDYTKAIAVDLSGNVYVTGYSYGDGTSMDYATIKYDPAGNELWVKRYNGPANGPDEATVIAVDGAGNVYVTGKSYGGTTGNDYATIKYDPAGNELWVKRYNGPANGPDEATAIAVDGAGNVYVTGASAESEIYLGYLISNYDYATIKYDPAGNELWVKRYNGPGNGSDYTKAIAVDLSGNVYVTGYSYGDGTSLDYATVKYDSAGNELWVKRYNGPANGTDEATAIAVDGAGNVYVTGGSAESETYLGYLISNFDYATIKYPNTFTGNDVTVDLGDGVSINFDSVTTDGITYYFVSSTPPATPTFQVVGVYYDISTTAAYLPPIRVTLPYDPTQVPDPSILKMYHYKEGQWVDVTEKVDPVNHTVTGRVDSLSWFALGIQVGMLVAGGPPLAVGGPPADTISPTIWLASPDAGWSLTGTIGIIAGAVDNVGVSRVDFYIDGTLVSRDETPPSAYDWDTTTVADGTHTISVAAYDAAGNVGIAVISVTVANAAPRVAPTAPTGIQVAAPAPAMFLVHAGAFRSLKAAKRRVARLIRRGFPAQITRQGGSRPYLVQIRLFEDLGTAKALLKRLFRLRLRFARIFQL